MSGRASWGLVEGDELVPGRHVSRLLGGGTRYEAYLTWDDTLHALVVAKVLRPDRVDDPSAREGLVGEAEALAALSHPIIVRSFGLELAGERPHLLLEYLDGPRLSTLIRRFGVIVEQLLPLALELCSALHYVHARGFLHLDVKPRNVVMSSRPRLVDLSIALPVDVAPTVTRPVGTDAYMAPEQCDPERFSQIGPPSDVWGLGVTLYESLARRRPFTPAADQRFPQLRTDPDPLPKNVPQPLADAILACLEPTPGDRPSPSELASTLEPLAAALPAPRLGLFRPGGRRQRSDFAVR